MDLLPQLLIPLSIIAVLGYFLVERKRERDRNAPLRGQIEARVRFETPLARASILGTGGFGGTRGFGATLLSGEPSAPHLTRPSGRPTRAGRYPLRRLAAALVTVLIADTATGLGAIALPSLGGLAGFGLVVAVVMFVAWFYRARVNAEGHGWPQRLSAAWAIACWIAPVANLWLPFLIMADIWRAGLPAEARANRALLPGIWWACLLAFFCLLSVTAGPHQAWYAGVPVMIAGALAAIMTALLVRKVSNGPLGR